ncbi:MAG: tRNA-specific adenosine deaminase [Desulfococcus sp. 4484_241]|nr:MAG: tRNA-specific adenosine deaminase [Desulfococcus sp. 4484_241]
MQHERFMKIAITQARQALDAGEFPVGCVIADGRKVVATGTRQGTAGNRFNETGHAEMVALGKLDRSGVSDAQDGLVLYSTLEPCLMCFGAAMIHGVAHIVYGYEDVMGGGTSCDLSCLPPLYSNRRISITPGVMRKECLELFRRYFKNPANRYLKDTLLAKHALSGV